MPSENRRRRASGRRSKRRWFLGMLIVSALTVAVVVGVLLLDRGPSRRSAAPKRGSTIPRPHRPIGELRARIVDTVPSPRQQAPAVAFGPALAMLGGLAVGEKPVASVVLFSGGKVRSLGRLAGSTASTGAATIRSLAYVPGGRRGERVLDTIVSFNLRTGRTRIAGHLKVPTADAGIASLSGRIYVVGGFTGKRWLRTVVEWRPGKQPRVVARLPVGVRFPAVVGVANRLLVVGGSNPDGVASRVIYSIDVVRGSVRALGRLPKPLTHAAAVRFRSAVYVIGGRGADPYGSSSRIFAIDPRSGRVTGAGSLPHAVRDASAVVAGKRIIVAGGVEGRLLSPSIMMLDLAGGPTQARSRSGG